MQVGGGGGNRTRVRKGSYRSFYTFSRLGFLSHRPSAERQMDDRPAPFISPGRQGRHDRTIPNLRRLVESPRAGYPGDVTA